MDGRKFQGTREIAAALEEIVPEPPRFPKEPALRREVEDAERWGEEVLQDAARRIVVWGLLRNRSAIGTQLADARRIQRARLPISPRLAALTSGPPVMWYGRRIGADDKAVEADLRALPEMLTSVDAWISAGVLGSASPNAADFQIATSVG